MGLVGLIVVLACLNETTPAVLTTTPTATSVSATPTRKTNGNSSGATSDDASHMQSAKNSATTGGGIFSSSEPTAVLSNHHRLLGEDTRHRALRRCLRDRGQERRREVAGGVDAGHAGLAAFIDLEGDTDGRIDRGEAQCFMQACGRRCADGRTDVDRDVAARMRLTVVIWPPCDGRSRRSGPRRQVCCGASDRPGFRAECRDHRRGQSTCRSIVE